MRYKNVRMIYNKRRDLERCDIWVYIHKLNRHTIQLGSEEFVSCVYESKMFCLHVCVCGLYKVEPQFSGLQEKEKAPREKIGARRGGGG